jgi:hypothetical protein
LPKHKEIFLAVVSAQGFNDVFDTASAALVTQGGEPLRIALSGQNGINDGLGADSVNVSRPRKIRPVVKL